MFTSWFVAKPLDLHDKVSGSRLARYIVGISACLPHPSSVTVISLCEHKVYKVLIVIRRPC